MDSLPIIVQHSVLANHNVIGVILFNMDEKLKRQLGTDLILIRNEPVSRFCLDCNETLNHSSFSVPWKKRRVGVSMDIERR